MALAIFKGVGALGLLAVGGCAFSTEESDTGSGGEERLGSVEQYKLVACDQDIYTTCSEWSSNGVTLRTYQCNLQGPANGFTSGSCPVETGFTVVGGGAQLQGNGPKGSGFTYSGVGSGSLTTRRWEVEADRFPSSNDNLASIITYAIGMKLGSHTETQLRQIMLRHGGAGSIANGTQPQATINVGPGRVLVGGGFTTWGHDPTDIPRVFVVDAYATSMVGGTWRVNAQSPEGDTGGVQAHAWSLPECPPLWTGRCFATQVIFTNSATGTNSQGAYNVNPQQARGVVFTGGISSAWGRYQHAFFPLTVDNVAFGGSGAFTTDYAATVSGYARAYSFLIWRP